MSALSWYWLCAVLVNSGHICCVVTPDSDVFGKLTGKEDDPESVMILGRVGRLQAIARSGVLTFIYDTFNSLSE